MRDTRDRKPYDPAPIKPNWNSPLAKAVRRIQQRNAKSASDAIKRIKADLHRERQTIPHIPTNIKKICRSCEDTFMPNDARETECTWCDALEGPNA